MAALFLFFLFHSLHAATLSPLASRGYAVIPEPQRVQLTPRDLSFGPSWSLESAPGAESARAALLEELDRRRFPKPSSTGTRIVLSLRPGSVEPGNATDPDKASIAAQAYRLELSPTSIQIRANASEGLFYGVQTLVQLLTRRADTFQVPEGVITDWPDLHLRHIYWDDAHHLDRLPELKRVLRQAAFFKINGVALKLEGHFQFRRAPALVEPYALTPAEYQELTDYGLRYHVQLIPYIDGPGHIAFILKHPAYAKYRAFPDSNYEMCVVNPDAVKLLSGMFQDLVDANRGGKFVYLSTDEPYYIGMADNPQCREKAAAEAKGSVGKLLAEFITRIAEPLHKQDRTVMFWGEYPLKPADIPSLPNYLVNGEVAGPEFDPLFRKHGIRQMIYTSTQGGLAQLFPDYYSLPNTRRLHPVPSQVDRVADGFRKISYDPARTQTDIIGAVVAGWADMGLHPDTFWLGYATITAAAWHPGTPNPSEAASSFHRLFYGEGASGMDRVYQLMSQQAQTWLDSWESGPGQRKPLFGNSYGIFNPKRPAKDQTLPLPPFNSGSFSAGPVWLQQNARRLDLAAQSLSDNDELLGLLHQNLRAASLQRGNLEIYLAVSHLFRQNLEMLLDLGRIHSQLQAAAEARAANRPKDALEALDKAIELAYQIRQARNVALRDASATYSKTWFPRVAEANGRKFLHDLDDVKDHIPDRTVDMNYLILRQLQLPFGQWIETVRTARNRYAAANGRKPDNRPFDWLDLGDHPVVGGVPEE